jgi:VWFA-related protein
VHFLLLALIAQEPIRVSTRLIETNLIVRDSHGPVVDLGADSFKVFEDGKEQRIAVIRISKAEAVKAAPPGIYTNRIGGAVRYRVLLIDTVNTDFADQALVRTRMIKMFSGMEIHDPMAIYTIRVLQDFTTDAESRDRGVSAGAITSAGDGRHADAVYAKRGRAARGNDGERVRATCFVSGTGAGRKTLL